MAGLAGKSHKDFGGFIAAQMVTANPNDVFASANATAGSSH